MAMDMSAIDLKKLKKAPAPMIDYNVWIPTSGWPSVEGGVEQFYPQSIAIPSEEDEAVVDTVAVVKGSITMPGMDARQCFLAALVFASENFDTELGEGFEDIDYKNLNFKILLKSTQGANNTETTYTRSLNVAATDGMLNFTTTDIDCRYREKGIVPRTLRLEKLQPDKNSRHASLVKEFTEVNSSYIDKLRQYIATRNDIMSPNFDKLAAGSKVIPGMNMDEVTILLGVPLNKRKSGEKFRWIYSNDFVIIFTDGVVTKIVD